MEEVLVFGHKNPDTDAICSSIVMANLTKAEGLNARAVRLGKINKETRYVLDYLKIEEPEEISRVKDGANIILVDHNSKDESVENRDNAKILAVIDHHRITNFETKEPLYYLAQPYGCTSTILYERYIEENIEINKTIATLMLSAIISDTLLLKSPTTTENDRKAVKELAKIAELDYEKYGLDMLKAGTDISDFSASEVIDIDSKKMSENGKNFILSQVNTADINEVFSRKEELSFAIEKEISDYKLDFYVLIITDILNSNSLIWTLGEDKHIVEQAFNTKFNEDDAFLAEGVVSRKKQILPKILEVIDK